MMYLFRGINMKTLKQKLAKVHGPDVDERAIIETLTRNGQVLRNYKLWLMYVVANRVDHKEARRLAVEWHVEPTELESLKVLSVVTIKYMRGLSKKYKVMTLPEFERAVNTIATDPALRTWLGKFVYRKLRFIYTSNGFDKSDLTSELLMRGLQGLMLMYPIVSSMLHAVNIVKRRARQSGLNMIDYYTTAKSGRLARRADGSFESVVVSYEHGDAIDPMAASRNEDSSLLIDVRNTVGRYAGKARVFLETLSGNYSPDYLEWLSNKFVHCQPENIDRMPTAKQLRLVTEYLKLPESTTASILSAVRSDLQAYRGELACL